MQQPKRVLWMSRHYPCNSQIVALQQKYGSDVIIDRDPNPYDDARKVARRYREGKYDDMVIVAPLTVVAIMCHENIPMLWSESVEEYDPSKIEFCGARGQGFRFVRFRRIKRVAVEFED